MRPLLSLVMIVKNEAPSIRAVLEAAKPFVDRWTILDTGSTDGTQGIVREAMSGIPGELFEEPFIDFAASRNRVLDLDVAHQSTGGEPAVFQIMLSGDEHLRDGAALRECLEAERETDVDCHLVRLTLDDVAFYTPRVFRTGSAWRYEGVVHEAPYNRAQENAPIGTVPHTFIEHIVSDPERRFANIWEHHIPRLEAHLEEYPDDERALTFLGQSYKALLPFAKPGEALTFALKAMSYYMRRLAIPTGSDVERNFIRLHFLDIARTTGIYSPTEMLARCRELAEADPLRPDTALLHMKVASKVVPVLQVYELAVHAARVAVEATNLVNSSPVSTSCGWEAHLFAAKAALQIAKKHPDATLGDVRFAELAQDHVAKGLDLGGPGFLFDRIIEEATLAGAGKTAPSEGVRAGAGI